MQSGRGTLSHISARRIQSARARARAHARSLTRTRTRTHTTCTRRVACAPPFPRVRQRAPAPSRVAQELAEWLTSPPDCWTLAQHNDTDIRVWVLELLGTELYAGERFRRAPFPLPAPPRLTLPASRRVCASAPATAATAASSPTPARALARSLAALQTASDLWRQLSDGEPRLSLPAAARAAPPAHLQARVVSDTCRTPPRATACRARAGCDAAAAARAATGTCAWTSCTTAARRARGAPR